MEWANTKEAEDNMNELLGVKDNNKKYKGKNLLAYTFYFQKPIEVHLEENIAQVRKNFKINLVSKKVFTPEPKESLEKRYYSREITDKQIKLSKFKETSKKIDFNLKSVQEVEPFLRPKKRDILDLFNVNEIKKKYDMSKLSDRDNPINKKNKLLKKIIPYEIKSKIVNRNDDEISLHDNIKYHTFYSNKTSSIIEEISKRLRNRISPISTLPSSKF